MEQTGNALKFLSFFTASGLGATTLTVTVDVYGPAGSITTGQAAVEVGGGLYSYTLAGASVVTEGEYIAVFKTTGTADVQHVPSLWVVGRAGVEHLDADMSSRLADADYNPSVTVDEAGIASAVWAAVAVDSNTTGSMGQKVNAAGAASDPLANPVPGAYASGTAGAILGALNAGQVTVVSPVSDDGTELSIVRGDDYDADEGRAFEFTEVNGTWGSVNLEGATVALALVNGGTALSYAGSVVTATGSTRKVRFELTSVQSEALAARATTFAVIVTQTNNRVATLIRGSATIQ